MKYFTVLCSVAIAAPLLLSVSAFALEAEHFFTHINRPGSDPYVFGTTIGRLRFGDTFEVAIELDNTAGDDIAAVFTHLKYDNSVIEIVDGFTGTADFRASRGAQAMPSFPSALPRMLC